MAKTCVAPLERVRILAQTGAAGSSGMGATWRRVVEREGVRGLWRGNAINCARVFPSKAVLFATNDMWKSVLGALVVGRSSSGGGGGGDGSGRRPRVSWEQRVGVSFAAGSLAGLTSVMVTYPLDFLRTQMAGRVDASGHAWRILRDTVRADGVRALYRGSSLTLAGAVPYEGIKFCTFDLAQRAAMGSSGGAGDDDDADYAAAAGASAPPARLGVVARLACGALAGTVAGFVMYPNDTVRKRLQIEPAGTFRSAWHCYTETMREGGVPRFYRGVVPYLLRMIPNAMIQFATYDALKQHFDGGS